MIRTCPLTPARPFPWGYTGGSDHEAEFSRHRMTALAKG